MSQVPVIQEHEIIVHVGSLRAPSTSEDSRPVLQFSSRKYDSSLKAGILKYFLTSEIELATGLILV
jgi:hypothetical protein